MTSIAENTASCALCRRHLLVGEPARLYQDPASKRFLKVCPLCYEQADRRGWRADGRPIVAVHANPPRDHALREREGLIDRLRGQLQSVEFDLDQVRSALAKAEQQAGELRTVKREMKELTGELRQLAEAKKRSDEAATQADATGREAIHRHHQAAAELDQRTSQIGQLESRLDLLEQELEHERKRYADLAEARRREGDPRTVRRIALDAFNRSEHIERVVAISRSLGEPIVHVGDAGCDLPRPVRITVVWDISWYEYLVRLDLHEQTVSVEEERRGDDPRLLPSHRLNPNGVLRSDRIVLTMQAYGVGAASA